MNTASQNTTPPTKLADLKPDFSDAKSAAAGWHTITTPIRVLSEADIAESIMSALNGTAPGASPVAFCLVGIRWRFEFARRRSELAGFADDSEPPATGHATESKAA